MPHLYSGLIVQIDIEDDAESLIEIITFLQRFCRLKQNAIEAVLAQQPLHPLERARIVVDDKNDFSLGQDRWPSSARPHRVLVASRRRIRLNASASNAANLFYP